MVSRLGGLLPAQARRWVVEWTLAWLSKCRALLVRYDKPAENFFVDCLVIGYPTDAFQALSDHAGQALKIGFHFKISAGAKSAYAMALI